MQYVLSLLFAAICYLIYSYVAVCMSCAVRCVIIICCYLSFFNYSSFVFQCFVYSRFLVFHFYFLVCIFCVYVFVCVFFLFLHSCLFSIFVQVYRPLPPDGNRILVNKYHTSYTYKRITFMFSRLCFH